MLSFACGIIVRPRDECSSLKARVVDRVGARAVIDSIDMVSRLEVTFVCIPSPRYCDTLGVYTVEHHLFSVLHVRNCLSKGLF